MRTQPVPEVSEADIVRVVERDLLPIDRVTALAALATYGTEPHEYEPIRVRLAALKLANGSLADLLRELASAKLDFRDVIGPAEYPRAMKVWSRVEVDDAERQQIYAADWKGTTSGSGESKVGGRPAVLVATRWEA